MCLIYWLVVLAFRMVKAVCPDGTANDQQCTPIDCSATDDGLQEKYILETIMANYSKQSIPIKSGMLANVELHINDITSLSEINSEFILDIFFSSVWHDPALRFSYLNTCLTNITLDLDYLDKIWQPNTCIVNTKQAEIHKSPSPNIFLILYDTGKVWKNVRMRVIAPCLIDLRNFPFDSQTCKLRLESYSYNSEKVRLEWFKHDPLTLMKKMELPDFTLSNYSSQKFTLSYPNGNWDELVALFKFNRRYGFFLLQAYVPTLMTIFVAWINFFMDSHELSTRATLAISAFLALTLQFGNILKNQPPVSYIKAIDVWMLGGIVFLFAALAELAIISFMQRQDKPSQTPAVPHTQQSQVAIYLRKTKNKYLTPYCIDRVCFLSFPPLFVVFNIFYWGYYLGINRQV